MLKYSLRKILNRVGRSSKQLILAFKAHASSGLPKNFYDPLYSHLQHDFSGDSFMLNPGELITYAFKWKPREVAEYICLASYRNYSDYSVYGKKTLDLFHSPVSEDIINQNRLLRIKDGNIHFYYEEAPNRRIQIWH